MFNYQRVYPTYINHPRAPVLLGPGPGACFSLRADHAGALSDAPQRLAQVAAAAHEGHLRSGPSWPGGAPGAPRGFFGGQKMDGEFSMETLGKPSGIVFVFFLGKDEGQIWGTV